MPVYEYSVYCYGSSFCLSFCLCMMSIVYVAYRFDWFSGREIYGGYCGGVPPLPIPNRAVKPACADGTAMQCGRVGGCRFFEYILEAGVPDGMPASFLCFLKRGYEKRGCIKMEEVRFAQKSHKSIHSVYQHFDLLDLYRFVGFLVRRTTEFLFWHTLFFIVSKKSRCTQLLSIRKQWRFIYFISYDVCWFNII